MTISKNTLALIGNTPMLELSRIYNGPGRIYAKAEYMQPGGSIKDRAAFKIIELAYKTGKLKKAQPVIEMTSGNMGAGLAVVCNIFGNPFIAVMSEGNSSARGKMMTDLGADVVFVPQVDGQPGQVTGKDIEAAVEKAKEISVGKQGYYVDQFNNEGSVMAHLEGTGPEIWENMGGTLDAFVASVGSGGTFIGVSRYLKTINPLVKCVAVEPEGAEILAGKKITKPKHIIQGTGYNLIPPHWDTSLVDEYIAISDEEAKQYKDLLAKLESIYAGYSAAANVCACVKLLKKWKVREDFRVATVLCDSGLKY